MSSTPWRVHARAQNTVPPIDRPDRQKALISPSIVGRSLGTKRVLVFTVPALIMSCERVTVREYQAPKETLVQHRAAPMQVEATPSSGQTTLVNLRVPANWQRQSPAATRKASFIVEGKDGEKVDISVSSFPGESGGLLANINRWREQAGLNPVGPEQLEATIERRRLTGREFVIVDLINDRAEPKNSQRIIGAIVSGSDETWFFKMTGDDAFTAAQRPAFLELLESAQFGSE